MPSAPRPASRARVVLSGVLGLVLGLGLTENAFRLRDGNAFPLLNVYERDELRAVRLTPNSATVVGSRTERITYVRVNADGYRGPDWPAPSAGEVLVVGDSISFGLGVEEEEAFPARLGAALHGGHVVIDASVPTYGPPEYLITMEQILARRQPATVVLTVNLLNDFAEVGQPNTTRHAAVDGWAMRFPRGGTLPGTVPLRQAVIERSHAALALWRFWQITRQPAAPPAPDDSVGALLGLAAARDRAVAAYDDARRQWDVFGRVTARVERVWAGPLPAPALPPEPPPLPMESVIRRARAIAEAAHARLVVVTVPLDAQISPEARERHRLTEAQTASLDRVVADLTRLVGPQGAIGVDPSYALRHAPAPAYLRDGHLSAAGHEAVARAVADAMDARAGGV